jgi:hypothetical protein
MEPRDMTTQGSGRLVCFGEQVVQPKWLRVQNKHKHAGERNLSVGLETELALHNCNNI